MSDAITVSCAGCRHHIRTDDRTEFFCDEGEPGYPNETNETCAQWRKPLRGKHSDTTGER